MNKDGIMDRPLKRREALLLLVCLLFVKGVAEQRNSRAYAQNNNRDVVANHFTLKDYNGRIRWQVGLEADPLFPGSDSTTMNFFDGEGHIRLSFISFGYRDRGASIVGITDKRTFKLHVDSQRPIVELSGDDGEFMVAPTFEYFLSQGAVPTWLVANYPQNKGVAFYKAGHVVWKPTSSDLPMLPK